MPTATMRISQPSRTILRGLAAREGQSMQAIMEKALEEYRRKRILEQANAEYTAMRQDSAEWAAWQEEIAVGEATLADGLNPQEGWTAEGEVQS